MSQHFSPRAKSTLLHTVLITVAMLFSVAALYGQSVPRTAPITQQEFTARREALAARLRGDGVLVALGDPEPKIDYFSFWQNPSMQYLTGFQEPNAALVMVKRDGKVTSMLFVQPRNPNEEVWTGARLGPEGVTRETSMTGRLHSDLRTVLDSLLGDGPMTFFIIGDVSPGHDPLTADDQFVRAIASAHPNAKIADASPIVMQMRGKKSPAEITLIRRAIEITNDAHRAAFGVVAPNRAEYEVQAVIEYTFRRNGADRPSFASIVGSGPNATTLHYNADNRVMRDGEVVVMDIGASYEGYAADITRTVPVNGTFTTEQRAIYQAVRNAQAAAEKTVKVGASAQLMVDSVNATIGRELTALGLIESPTATYACPTGAGGKCPQFKLFYMHGLGHAIGLDVHDPGTSGIQIAPLQAGDIFTIEPGIYIRANTIDIIPDVPENKAFRDKIRPLVERYKNIGIRIEDDYLVTPAGVEWLSKVPREVAEIEAAMHAAKP